MPIEKKKQEEKKPTIGGGDSIFDVAPEPENKNVSVSSGPYIENLPVAGMTVGAVRKRYADRFDIDDKAQSVVNGKDADEDYTLKAGEALMFVRHAGEKGANTVITIDGEAVTAETPEGTKTKGSLRKMLANTGPGISTGPCVLPSGVKAVLSQGRMTIMIWEQPPKIQKLSWIRPDSPAPYGRGAKYRNVSIALPYLVIFAVFQRDDAGMPHITKGDECFFSNKSLKSLDDELCFPALLNCSKWNQTTTRTPLSWICTQHLLPNEDMGSDDLGRRFAGGMEAVRYCLLETSFNLSSEHHEGNSWFGASKGIDPRIRTVEAWEEATAQDPLFVLDMPWIKTKHSVKGVADRIFNRYGAADTTAKSSNDLARLITA